MTEHSHHSDATLDEDLEPAGRQHGSFGSMDSGEVNVVAVEHALKELGATSEHASNARAAMGDRLIALMVYGSYSRGDYDDESDLDLLAVIESPAGTKVVGRVSLSFYTPEQIRGAKGTLFGMHLARDGQVLHDTDGFLTARLEEMGEPDPVRSLERVRHLSTLIDVGLGQPEPPLAGLARVARYFLRTAIYIQALAHGRPCFSVSELADRYEDPALRELLKSRQANSETVALPEVEDLALRLREVVGSPSSTEFVTLQQLIVAEWESDRERAAMATLVLADGSSELDYSTLPKVLL